MTIVTRQSSPKTGSECPGVGGSMSLSAEGKRGTPGTAASGLRRKFKVRDKNCEGAEKIVKNSVGTGNCEGLEGVKSVMCETTNLTPAKSAALLKSISLSSDDSPCHRLGIGTSDHGNIDTLKKPLKKISKVKLKNGTSLPKEDIVACRKSKRLINKHSQFDKSKFGAAADSKNALGRLVELINPLETLDRDCLVTKVLFLGSLDLKTRFCNTTPKNPVGSLKRLCIRQLVRQRKSQLESNELYFPAEKRRRDSTEEELDPVTLMERVTDTNWKLVVSISKLEPGGSPRAAQDGHISNKRPHEDQGGFSSFETHISSVLRRLPHQINNETSTLESITDCVRKILKVGTNCVVNGPPAAPEVQDLINDWNHRPQVNNKKQEDEEGWSSWEDHVMSLSTSSSSNTNDKAPGHSVGLGDSKNSDSVSTTILKRRRGRPCKSAAKATSSSVGYTRATLKNK